MRLVVLIDNCTINGRNLKGEGGASYYIEDEDKNLIYKTIIDKIIIQRKEVIEVVFK